MSDTRDASEASVGRYLTFCLAGDLFALDIGVVREILDMTTITRIPLMPPAVLGVVNVRGAAVPVVDLRLRFGMPAAERTVDTRIIIVETPRGHGVAALGAIADSVREVLELEASQVSPPPDMGLAVRSDCLRAVGRLGQQFILILDIERVLGSAEALGIGGAGSPKAPVDEG